MQRADTRSHILRSLKLKSLKACVGVNALWLSNRGWSAGHAEGDQLFHNEEVLHVPAGTVGVQQVQPQS